MKKVKCWEVFNCNKKGCPAYKSKNLKCWLFSGTHCRDEIQGKFLEKMEMCLSCKVFKANMDVSAMKETVKVINNQFNEFSQIVGDRDRELEGISMEMALGLSEVFEALKKISSGDPSVLVSEISGIELITKLKHMINLTAEDIREIVNQTHEIAIGLAEHFDILSKVSKGDLGARVTGISQIELLESLKRVTNQMIQSISTEITERKKAEDKLLRQSTVLDAINRLFREALTCETDEGVAQVCLKKAEELTGSKFGFIGEVNEAGLFDTVALSDPGWDACKLPKSDAVLMIKNMQIRGIWGKVLKEELPLIVNDPASHPDHIGTPDGHPTLTSFLGIPIKYMGKTIGMIALANKESGYDITDQQDVEAISVAFVEALKRKRAEIELKNKEFREALILHSLPMVFYTAQPLDGFNWIWVSEQIEQISGFPASKYFEEKDFLSSRIHPNDSEYVLKEFETIYNKGAIALEYRWLCADRSYRWVRDQAVLIRDEQGKPKEIIGTWRDITERKQAEEELQKVNENLKGWVEELEQRNREISLFGEMGGMLQTCLSEEEAHSVIAKFAQHLFPSEAGSLYVFSASRNVLESVTEWGDSPPGERVFSPDDCWALRRGQVHLIENISSGMLCRHLGHPPSGGYMCVPMMAHGETLGLLHLQSRVEAIGQSDKVRDQLIESKKRLAITMAEQVAMTLSNLKLQEILRTQSIRDPLTGLFNRRYMEESLEREIRRATRNQSQLGVIMIDLDHFKRFNDTFSHAAGDVLLRELGTFLRTSVRGEDIACRYGGEEFALIMPEASLEITRKRAELLREGVRHLNVRYLGQTLGMITISLGVAIFPEHGPTGEAVLRAADAALYRAKAEGRDKVIVEEAVS
ncbi:MAG: diguanylate cyclase [Nitrospirota bacterium]